MSVQLSKYFDNIFMMFNMFFRKGHGCKTTLLHLNDCLKTGKCVSSNNRAPRLTFTDPWKPKMRPGAREESVNNYIVLQKANLPSLEIPRLRTMAIKCFKIIHDLSPPCLSNLVSCRESTYSFRYTNSIYWLTHVYPALFFLKRGWQ